MVLLWLKTCLQLLFYNGLQRQFPIHILDAYLATPSLGEFRLVRFTLEAIGATLFSRLDYRWSLVQSSHPQQHSTGFQAFSKVVFKRRS